MFCRKAGWALLAPLKVLAAEHRAAEANAQYKLHAKDPVAKMARLVQKSSAFMQMVLWAKTWLLRSSPLTSTVPWVKYAGTALGAASFTLPGGPAMIGAGFCLYLFICRTLYARGSAKPVHYDIKRIGLLPESPYTTTDEDVDYNGIDPDDDGGGHLHGRSLLLEYSGSELLENWFLCADEMFSPEWYDRNRLNRTPSFTLTVPTEDMPTPRGTMTPNQWSGSRVQTPDALRGSASASSSQQWTPRRASAPMTPLIRPRLAEHLAMSLSGPFCAAGTDSLSPYSKPSDLHRRASSPGRSWRTPDMALPQPIVTPSNELILRAQSPGSVRSLSISRTRLPRSSDSSFSPEPIPRPMSSPSRLWYEENMSPSSPNMEGKRPFRELRATFQPTVRNDEPISLTQPRTRQALPLTRQSSHYRYASQQVHASQRLLGSPSSIHRPRSQRSTSSPLRLEPVQWNIDDSQFSASQSPFLKSLSERPLPRQSRASPRRTEAREREIDYFHLSASQSPVLEALPGRPPMQQSSASPLRRDIIEQGTDYSHVSAIQSSFSENSPHPGQMNGAWRSRH